MRLGEDVTIYPLAKIVQDDRFAAGNSVIIDDFVFIQAGEATRLGSFVHIGAHTSVAGGGTLEMDDFSALSGGVRIYTGNEDYVFGSSLTNPTVPAPWRTPLRSFVKIGKHALVGSNSVVLPGVTIGEGAVVGAMSLVKQDLAPWTINVGQPARVVSRRPSGRILELEADLRRTLFDPQGNYIAKRNRHT